MTKRRSFIFFIWVGPAHMLFSGCDTIVLDYYPIITYNYFIALLVTTAKKTQVIMGLAPEKASRIRAVCGLE